MSNVRVNVGSVSLGRLSQGCMSPGCVSLLDRRSA
jgi:hypothetical protein